MKVNGKMTVEMTWLQRTRKKCWAIRNRIYPEHERPRRLFDNEVLARAGEHAILLEIGCGRDAEWLRGIAPHFRLAIGIDPEIAGQAAVSSGCVLMVGDGHTIPLESGTVDVIASQDVVEHLAFPAQFFAECARVLRPGGRLIISTVNKFFYPVLLGRLLPHTMRQWVNGIVSGTADDDTFPALYRANTPSTLESLASQVELRTVSLRYISCHPVYLIFSTVVYRIGVAFERFTSRHERLGFLRHLIHAVFELPGEPGSRLMQKSR